MNHIAVTGRLLRDPAFARIAPDEVLATMTIAVPRWSRRGLYDVLRLEAHQDVAEHCAHELQRGSLVGVQGRVRDYTPDKQPADKYQERYVVFCDYVVALGDPLPSESSFHDQPERGCGVNTFAVTGRLTRPPQPMAGPGVQAWLRIASRPAFRTGMDFFTVLVRNRLAESCLKHLREGDRVWAEGRFERRELAPRQGDTARRIRHCVPAYAVEFLRGHDDTPWRTPIRPTAPTPLSPVSAEAPMPPPPPTRPGRHMGREPHSAARAVQPSLRA